MFGSMRIFTPETLASEIVEPSGLELVQPLDATPPETVENVIVLEKDRPVGSADGTLYTCLFAVGGTDLKTPLRAGESDDEVAARVRSVWAARTDRYSELRSAATERLPKVEMFALGG